MATTEVTEYLFQYIFPDFLIHAEALWEISPGSERDDGLVGDVSVRPAVAVVEETWRMKKR